MRPALTICRCHRVIISSAPFGRPGGGATSGSNRKSGRNAWPGIITWRANSVWSGAFRKKLDQGTVNGIIITSLCRSIASSGAICAADVRDRVHSVRWDAVRPRYLTQICSCGRSQSLSQPSQHVPLGLRSGTMGALVQQLAGPSRREGTATSAPGEALGTAELMSVMDRVSNQAAAR